MKNYIAFISGKIGKNIKPMYVNPTQWQCIKKTPVSVKFNIVKILINPRNM